MDREKRASLLDKDHNSNIWCFCLSSVDENNITTFANIAHEIGHIIFKKEKDDILIIRDQVLQEKIDTKFTNRALKLLNEYPKEKRLYINSVSTQLLFSLIEETCADVVGSILLGPTFLLSLNEFTWDVIGRKSENIWFIELEKERLNYPSIAFRKKCIKSLINYDSFLKGMKEISSLNKIDEMIDKYLKSETTETDRFLIKYDEELEKYLNNFMSEISDAFLLFAHRVYDYIINKYKKEIEEPDYSKIDDLIKRLSNKIPPNIVNDGTLLGQTANYSEILLSSYLSKIYTFYRSDGMNLEEKIKDLSIINKLTTKAIECTYMQNEYLKEKKKTIK